MIASKTQVSILCKRAPVLFITKRTEDRRQHDNCSGNAQNWSVTFTVVPTYGHKEFSFVAPYQHRCRSRAEAREKAPVNGANMRRIHLHSLTTRAEWPCVVRARRAWRHNHFNWAGSLVSGNGHTRRTASSAPVRHPTLSRAQISIAMAVLIALLFSKYIYLAAFTSYYTFYLMETFSLPIKTAQIFQFQAYFSHRKFLL